MVIILAREYKTLSALQNSSFQNRNVKSGFGQSQVNNLHTTHSIKDTQPYLTRVTPQFVSIYRFLVKCRFYFPILRFDSTIT